MSYGFEIRNSRGQVVLDSDSPTAYIVRTFTLTSSDRTPSIPGHDRLYVFTLSPSVTGGFFAVYLENGFLVGGGGRLFYSNQSTLKFRDLTFFADNAPTKIDYGLEVRNSANQLTYSSAGVIFAMTNTINYAGGTSNYTAGNNDQWDTATVTNADRWLLIAGRGGGASNYNIGVGTPGSFVVPIVGTFRRSSNTRLDYCGSAIRRDESGSSAATRTTMSKSSVILFR